MNLTSSRTTSHRFSPHATRSRFRISAAACAVMALGIVGWTSANQSGANPSGANPSGANPSNPSPSSPAQQNANEPPASSPPASPEFDRLLGSGDSPSPLRPQSGPGVDASGSVAPDAPVLQLKREGSFVIDRLGRLIKSADGRGWEFALDADGQSLQDPPLRVLPNIKLMLMEDQLESAGRDLRFRVSGMLTEYRGRNHVLIEKVVVISDTPSGL